MSTARIGSIVTWAYVGAFGVPTIPVAIYLDRRGTLPRFMDLFEMYAGPWSSRFGDGAVIWLLLAFLVVTAMVAWSGWLAWRRRRAGGALNLLLLPVEAVFWIGFALPLPWVLGVARAGLIVADWRSLRR